MGPSGDLFISDSVGNAVWKLSESGGLSRFAGNGTPGYSGNGGSATLADVGSPLGIAADRSGNVYILQRASVRKVTAAGIISTVAGTGENGESGDGGPATQARLSNTRAIAVDSSGALYIGEPLRVRKVSSGGIIDTVAGGPVGGSQGDGGPATSATYSGVNGIAVTPDGQLYIADNTSIRRVSASGTIETIEGLGLSHTGDGGPAISSQLTSPSGLALDATGNLYIADNGSRIRKVSSDGTITTIAGGEAFGNSGDGGPAIAARMLLFSLTGMAVDAAGNLFVAELLSCDVRKISPQGVISTLAGSERTLAPNFPVGLALDGNGNLFIAGSRDHAVLKVESSGKITVFASTGYDTPYAVAVDGANNVYVSYSDATGITKYSPDGKPTNVAPIAWPGPMTVDAAGNIYAFRGFELLKIAPDGATTAIAEGRYQYPVDGTPALTGAPLEPSALAVDSAGNVYVADSSLNAVFKLHPMNGSHPPAISFILNAASGFGLAVAPGEIVTLYGVGIGPPAIATAQLDETGLLSTRLGDTQVLFDGTPAPLVYVSEGQSAAIVPYGVSGSTLVTVNNNGQVSSPVTLPVAQVAPGLFTANSSGMGQAAAVNEDGSLNSPAKPAAIGSVITLFATGEGQTTPAGINGKLAVDPLPSPLLPVTVTIGEHVAAVLYAGGAPGEVAGVMQINARIPAGVTPGDTVPVMLQVGDVQGISSAVTIAVR